MEEVKEKKRRGRKPDPDKARMRKPLSPLEKMAIEWVVMWETSGGHDGEGGNIWERMYEAIKRRYRNASTADTTIREQASRFANRREVKEYYESAKGERKFREQQLREQIEKDIFQSDARIRAFVRGRPVPSEEDEGMTVENTVRELIALKDRIEDPKDRAAILMKIADFGGLKADKEERHKMVYVPMACRDCHLYALGEKMLRAKAKEAGEDTSDIEHSDTTPQQR